MLVKTKAQKDALLKVLAEKQVTITQAGCALEPNDYTAEIGDSVRCVLYENNTKALLLQTAKVGNVDCDFMISPKDINKFKAGKTVEITVKAHPNGNRVSLKKVATETPEMELATNEETNND